MCGQINPMAPLLHGEATACRLFRVCGRLLAKALLDSQLVTVSLGRPLLKHLLALPVTFADLESVDAALHQSLAWTLSCPPDQVSVQWGGISLYMGRISVWGEC